MAPGKRTVLCSLIVVCLWFGSAPAQDDALYQKWEEAISLRGEQRFDEAVAVLRSIINDYPDSEDVCRRAYNQLVFVYSEAQDAESEESVAREAVTRFPNLHADTVDFPAKINELYDSMRHEMFGALKVREPEGAQVFIDGELLGEMPIEIPLYPVGEYELVVKREKHIDHVEMIVVEPSGDHNFDVSLKRRKDAKYWLTRIGGGAIAATAIALVAGGSSGGEELSPLPGAPDPP